MLIIHERIHNIFIVIELCSTKWSFLVCLFRRQSQAIVIARLALLTWSSCKNFNVAQKVLKVSTANLKYLLILTSHSCKTRGITFFGVMSLFN